MTDRVQKHDVKLGEKNLLKLNFFQIYIKKAEEILFIDQWCSF